MGDSDMIRFKDFIIESYDDDDYDDRSVLRKYTSSDEYYMYADEIAKDFKHYVRQFPYKGGRLYRGLNFTSPQEYLRFRRATRSGYIESKDITSWSPSLSEATGFAKSAKAFNLTASIAANWDPNERVSGFIGVVVAVDVPNGIGIDVNASGDAVETEVILPAGRFKIADVITEKKWRHLVSKLDINQEVMDAIEQNKQIDYKRFSALWRYKGGDLYDDVKAKIVEHGVMTYASHSANFHIEAKADMFSDMYSKRKLEAIKLLFPDGRYEFDIRGDVGLLQYLELPEIHKFLTPKLRQLIQKKVVDAINKGTSHIKGKQALIEYRYGFSHIVEMFDIPLSSLKYLAANYADTYKRFNLLMREYNKKRHFDMPEMINLLQKSMEGPFK